MHELIREEGSFGANPGTKDIARHLYARMSCGKKASQIYATRSPQQKRLIITKLFKNIQLDNDVLSVNYTEFAQAIAQNVLETRKLIGGKK